MRYVLPVFFGFFSSALGVALPGLINMTAAKVSMKDGRDRALLFIMGATIIVFFQTLLAVVFARFIDSRPDVLVMLREVGLALFIILTIYFLCIAKRPNITNEIGKIPSKKNRFFLGMLLSSLNFFPVPYYVFITILLSSYRLFSFDKLPVFFFLIGVVLGSLSVFYYYITFFKQIKSKTDFFLKNMNQIIGLITGIVAFVTLITIVKYYCK